VIRVQDTADCRQWQCCHNVSPINRESGQNKPKNTQPATDEKIPQVSIKTSPISREKRKVGCRHRPTCFGN